MRARVVALLIVATAILAACSSSKTSPPGTTTARPATTSPTAAPPPANASAKISHLFVIMLENKGYTETWGAASPATYLTGTLETKGQLLTNYYGIGHVSLDNYIAEISGQSPNARTQADCVTYTDFATTGTGPYGQALGAGCVYPPSVTTIADQLGTAGKTWKSYQEDMGNGPAGTAKTCRHPALGRADTTLAARKGDMYATRHNPFVYFHSIIDSPSCQTNVVDLSSFTGDLASDATPNLSFITPNLCHDGHDSPCVDGQPGGLTSADQFLSRWVPKILGSPAYQAGGLLIVTFDEAEPFGPSADASACCGTPTSPNSPRPGLTGPGGGRVGALVLSTQTKAGTSNNSSYNHYALLCSMEDVFGLPHLGFAAAPGLKCFGPDVYNSSSNS
jgi:hypothetical protein